MNANSVAQFLQTGDRTALGASSAIAQLLHNPQKLADILAQPPRSPEQILQDLAARGESIEQEARKFGETFLSGGSNHSKPPKYIERARATINNITVKPFFDSHAIRRDRSPITLVSIYQFQILWRLPTL